MTLKELKENMNSQIGLSNTFDNLFNLTVASNSMLKLEDIFSPISQLGLTTKSLIENMNSQIGLSNTFDTLTRVSEISRSMVKSEEMYSQISQLGLTTKSLIENMNSQIGLSNTFDTLTRVSEISRSILKSEDLDLIFNNLHISIEESIEKIDNINIEEENKILIKEQLEIIKKLSPELHIFLEAFDKKKYISLIFILMYILIINSYSIYSFYTSLINSDRHYKVNRNNVYIRSTPFKEKNNILIKLNKNTYIEKIESNDNGWIKIQFELEDGVEEEGWIYRTMITKID
jgi:hypothetical protein